jgi:quercetin dioxygenase-like cupin family protein
MTCVMGRHPSRWLAHADTVAVRPRTPSTLTENFLLDNISLTALAREQLELARRASSGRSSRTVYGGREHELRQTVIALAAGQTSAEHENPGEATVFVLHGRVRLVAGQRSWSGPAGHMIIVPDQRHSLEALEDSAVLLTTAMGR